MGLLMLETVDDQFITHSTVVCRCTSLVGALSQHRTSSTLFITRSNVAKSSPKRPTKAPGS